MRVYSAGDEEEEEEEEEVIDKEEEEEEGNGFALEKKSTLSANPQIE